MDSRADDDDEESAFAIKTRESDQSPKAIPDSRCGTVCGSHRCESLASVLTPANSYVHGMNSKFEEKIH